MPRYRHPGSLAPSRRGRQGMLLAQPVAKDRERPLASRLGPSEASNRAEMDLVRSSASTSLPVRLGLILPGNKRIAGAFHWRSPASVNQLAFTRNKQTLHVFVSLASVQIRYCRRPQFTVSGESLVCRPAGRQYAASDRRDYGPARSSSSRLAARTLGSHGIDVDRRPRRLVP